MDIKQDLHKEKTPYVQAGSIGEQRSGTWRPSNSNTLLHFIPMPHPFPHNAAQVPLQQVGGEISGKIKGAIGTPLMSPPSTPTSPPGSFMPTFTEEPHRSLQILCADSEQVQRDVAKRARHQSFNPDWFLKKYNAALGSLGSNPAIEHNPRQVRPVPKTKSSYGKIKFATREFEDLFMRLRKSISQ